MFRHIWPAESRVACIISIGAGRTTAAMGLPSANGLYVMNKIATDCQEIADELNEKCTNYPGLHHRLNVEVGLDSIAHGELDRLSEVTTHTVAYLESPETRRKIQAIVRILSGQADSTCLLNGLSR